MRDRGVNRTWLVILILAVACSKTESYKSNFASIRIEADKILGSNSEPYSGTLVARDQEIAVVARGILGPTYKHVEDADFTGLLLVVPVDKGLPSGRATVLIDLRAPKLNAEVARRSAEALAAARIRSPTIKIAEATFKAGKLDGTATVFAPAGASGKTSKVAEVQFRDHVIHGIAREFYPGANAPKRELHFEQGVQVGPQRWLHENSKLELEASYVAGAPQGEVKEYYANGAARSKSTYEGGKLIARESWYPTGQRRSVLQIGDPNQEEGWYSNGGSTAAPPNGVIEEFHGNGNVESRTTYVEGVKHGPFEMFYADGTKWKIGGFQNGKEHGRSQAWWKNGKPAFDATYVNGGLDGKLERWYANGKLWETATYANGRLTGPYRKWWKNGKPAHVYSYTDGKLDGDYQLFYDSGAKWAVGKYVLGKPQGALERWFPDGKLGYVMNHKDGRPDGPYKRWYADGKPRLEATYVAGTLHGELKNWLEDGTVYELARYERGIKVQTTRPDAPPR